MDKFVEFTGAGGPGCPDYGFGKALVMGYYDGNTVTGLWNYAQHYSMSDNSFDTEFGPSTVGAINLISGQTAGVNKTKGTPIKDHQIIDQVVIGDPDPLYDDCGSFDQVGLSGKNIGDLGLVPGRVQAEPTGVRKRARSMRQQDAEPERSAADGLQRTP